MECPRTSAPPRTPYYGRYLDVNRLLTLQKPLSGSRGKPRAHDETLFIIIHQTYELWFKQVQHELRACCKLLRQRSVDDNRPDMNVLVHRLKRIVEIWKVLNHQVDVLETMTPLDFLDFRSLLEPASGFQSRQFRVIEATLGLREQYRFAKRHYKHIGRGGFRRTDREFISRKEKETSLLQLVDAWLSRTPFFAEELWLDWKFRQGARKLPNIPVFWTRYRSLYKESLSVGDPKRKLLKEFDNVFFDTGAAGFCPESLRAALFITLYRDEPLLRLPFELLNALIEIDEQVANFRYRHFQMVRRMIGKRIGTGGNSPERYLRGTVNKNYIFEDLTRIMTFLIERRKLPRLPERLLELLRFIPIKV